MTLPDNGKQRLGPNSKGNRYLRWLLVCGALAVNRYAKRHGYTHWPWLRRLLANRPVKLAAVALANRIARVTWVMMAPGKLYKEPALLAA